MINKINKIKKIFIYMLMICFILINKVNKHYAIITKMAVKIDELDKNILNELMKDSRLSYRNLAKKLKVSVVTAMNRVKKLEEEKVIKEYSAKIDHTKLGYDLEVMIDVKIAKGNLFSVEKKIATDPHVIALYDITGEFDAVIIARFQNRKSLDSFLKKVQAFDFVERTHTKLILNTIKEDKVVV